MEAEAAGLEAEVGDLVAEAGDLVAEARGLIAEGGGFPDAGVSGAGDCTSIVGVANFSWRAGRLTGPGPGPGVLKKLTIFHRDLRAGVGLIGDAVAAGVTGDGFALLDAVFGFVMLCNGVGFPLIGVGAVDRLAIGAGFGTLFDSDLSIGFLFPSWGFFAGIVFGDTGGLGRSLAGCGRGLRPRGGSLRLVSAFGFSVLAVAKDFWVLFSFCSAGDFDGALSFSTRGSLIARKGDAGSGGGS